MRQTPNRGTVIFLNLLSTLSVTVVFHLIWRETSSPVVHNYRTSNLSIFRSSNPGGGGAN